MDESNSPEMDVKKKVEEVRKQMDENKKVWYEQEAWKSKGEPRERATINLKDTDINIINFNENVKIEDFLARVRSAIEKFDNHFPDAVKKLKWILIRDFQPPPLNGQFDSNGKTMVGTPEGTMILEPRAFEDIEHRISSTPNLEGTIVHELGHQIEDTLGVEWREKFPWMYVGDDPDDWIFDKSGEKDPSKLKLPVNKNTGDTAFFGRYPKSPLECVTDYAKINENEDLCESLVAYMYSPNTLRAVSMDKFITIQSHDQRFKASA